MLDQKEDALRMKMLCGVWIGCRTFLVNSDWGKVDVESNTTILSDKTGVLNGEEIAKVPWVRAL